MSRSNKINVIVISKHYIDGLKTPENVEIQNVVVSNLIHYDKTKKVDAVCVIDSLEENHYSIIQDIAQAHHYLISKNAIPDETDELSFDAYVDFVEKKRPYILPNIPLQDFVWNFNNIFHSDKKGGGYNCKFCRISYSYKGKAEIKGNNCIEFKGDFGNKFQQCLVSEIYFLRPSYEELEFWPEFEIDGNVDIELRIYEQFYHKKNSFGKIWTFNLDDLKEPVSVKNEHDQSCVYYFSYYIKGKGKAAFKQTQAYVCRSNFGVYSVGSKMLYDDNRENILMHFEPGDLKPPLNVYFGGFHSAKGLEGFNMIKKFNSPFLIFSDTRFDGGLFYLGSKKIESYIVERIKDSLNYLGFKNNDLILSGLSMGSTAALYYGSMLNPLAIVVGKPICNLGTMVENETLCRAGQTPYYLDIYHALSKRYGVESFDELNQVFWNTFNKMPNKETIIAVASMIEDDYDASAYKDLELSVKDKNKISLYGKQLHGKHNDKSSAIVNWFSAQIRQILTNYYKRKFDA